MESGDGEGCEIGARVAQIAYDSGGAGLEDGEEQMCLIQAVGSGECIQSAGS